MGKKRMRCPKCGNENINEMLVEFEWNEPKGVKDITTLPKFLYYMRYPEDRKEQGGRYGFSLERKGRMPKKILRILCDGVANGKHDGYVEIKPTRYGV